MQPARCNQSWLNNAINDILKTRPYQLSHSKNWDNFCDTYIFRNCFIFICTPQIEIRLCFQNGIKIFLEINDTSQCIFALLSRVRLKHKLKIFWNFFFSIFFRWRRNRRWNVHYYPRKNAKFWHTLSLSGALSLSYICQVIVDLLPYIELKL